MASSSKWIEGIGPESSVEDAARRSLEPRLAMVVQYLPLAAHLAAHDIEHVHRLRVATRRAVAALKLYRECVSPKKFRWIKKRLRKIRQAAGDARDLDVLADRLAREYGERVAPVVELITDERTTVQPAIVQIAERCRHRDQFVRKSVALLHSIHPPHTHEDSAGPPTFCDWAAEQLAKVAGELIADMPNESSDAAALHEFRIRAKALRYAIELLAPVFGPELRVEIYPIIEKLQERLGAIQDHVTATQRCQDWATSTRDDYLRETLRELADAEHRGLADAIRDFRAWWTVDRSEQIRQQLESLARTTNHPQAVNQT